MDEREETLEVRQREYFCALQKKRACLRSLEE